MLYCICAIMKYYYSLYFSNKVLVRLLIDNEYRRYLNAVRRHDAPSFEAFAFPNTASLHC